MDVVGPISTTEIVAVAFWGAFALGALGYFATRFGWDREAPKPPPTNRKRVVVPPTPVPPPANRKR
jgi:hypothetical protein